VPSISGTPPSSAAIVVIMIGRKRSRQACGSLPPARCSSRSAAMAKSTSMMPFFFTMPISSMMPISAIS
jgi:hypothetical protein